MISDRVKEALRIGDLKNALRYAIKSRYLGADKDAIERAYSAMQSPDFYRSIGKDPDLLIQEGEAALRRMCEQ